MPGSRRRGTRHGNHRAAEPPAAPRPDSVVALWLSYVPAAGVGGNATAKPAVQAFFCGKSAERPLAYQSVHDLRPSAAERGCSLVAGAVQR